MGTIKTTNIEPIADNGTVTLGSSGDTITVPTGVTVAGAMANTPAFLTNLASNQSINTGVNAKLLFTNEVLDTNNAFASNKFTVPSGEAGSYYVFCCCAWDPNPNGQRLVEIYKNGSLAMRVFSDQGESSGQTSASSGGIMVLSVGDYIEAYVQQNSGTTLNIRSNVERTFFGGYKLIGS